MGVGRWVREHMTADDGYAEDPDSVVTVAQVNPVVAAIVLAKLADAGIEARSVDIRAGYRGMPQGHIMCFARDREAAIAVVDEVLTSRLTDRA